MLIFSFLEGKKVGELQNNEKATKTKKQEKKSYSN
jgi:hypothetical protein